MVEKLFPDLFLKKSKLNLSGSIVESVIQFVYYIPNWGLSKYIKTCRPLAFTSYKAFLKNKKMSRTSLPASFSALFFKKNISLFTFY